MTLEVDVTNDWVDIKASLGLVAGSIYIVDSVIGDTTYIREGTTQPTRQIGHPIGPKESRVVTITSEGLWVRSDDNSAKIVLTVEA